MDVFTVALLGCIIVFGLMRNMFWLSLIGGLLLIAYAFGKRGEKPAVPAGAPTIRPIIVKRRYTGPASIYPERMKVRLYPNWDTRVWWERASGYLGTAARTALIPFGLHAKHNIQMAKESDGS